MDLDPTWGFGKIQSVVLDMEARIRSLEAALGKAVDTFEDIATASRLLGKPVVAESARIASVHCRQALATAETKGEQGG
jgi:hypothetical protein